MNFHLPFFFQPYNFIEWFSLCLSVYTTLNLLITIDSFLDPDMDNMLSFKPHSLRTRSQVFNLWMSFSNVLGDKNLIRVRTRNWSYWAENMWLFWEFLVQAWNRFGYCAVALNAGVNSTLIFQCALNLSDPEQIYMHRNFLITAYCMSWHQFLANFNNKNTITKYINALIK